jgi:exo-beta-1,3-glucanase (GH17 family)
VQSLGLKVLLGVFEFREHKDWTDAQVSAAIAAAKTYPNTVIGIVVGNEDMFDDRGPANRPRFVPNRVMQKRIVTDITTIKNALKNAGVSIPVTTAQRSTDWCGGSNIPGCDPSRNDSLNQSDPEKVLDTVQIIGANIFPYWSDKPATVLPPDPCQGQNVACQTQTAANVLDAVQKANSNVTGVIVTEEGWPDCADSKQPAANIQDEIAYYEKWSSIWSTPQNQSFDSYYFMAYDLSSTCPSDADKHFGLCSASGQTKSSSLISCTP